jgi:lysophospholipase L1-like esterase
LRLIAVLVMGMVVMVASAEASLRSARLPPSRTLLVVGDSLTVGTQPYMRRNLRGWHIHQRVAISTQVTEGPGILKSYGRHLPRVIFVNLGTNGDPRATDTFLSAIRRTMRIAGPRRCVVWASIVRPAVAGASYQRLNRVLAEQARKRRNLIMFRWVRLAHRHRSWFGPDHVHVTATGYKVRARAMAMQIRECRRLSLAQGRSMR